MVNIQYGKRKKSKSFLSMKRCKRKL